ncbi:P-loop containing nucleoside triphosphate hydrolase protein [Multifurca ochricompacta]|uniref:P-loop containing nucleoside triphosphate hydrolase protein n=1 Tax=Multifurca ochricompacta TaxID=376703 RepID=A0AAD4LZW7_9AGAM|nr:P-loop containing nucleoside triphosphate hydrolase protein [Multifurca ochricompacta]
MSITQEPRSPQIFFGRDAELAEIIQMIFTGIRSRPARIAILGPGGYGKTTLANAVLTHSQVHEHFRRARYFVACESIFSSGALLVELAKTLGVLDGASDASWSHIDATLNSKDTIICLDNFESPWDQAGDIRYSVEELLSRITAINSVTLLVTMRGTVRPAQTQWTKPPLTPLRTLSQDAAKEIWEEIGDNYDKSAEELIKAVDYVPLAVTLLAHLAQATTPSLLLKEWNQKQTRLIQMGHSHRLSNLESSIQLSIDSGRMAAYPPAKDLLGILSLIPDGIHTKQLERFQEILVNMDLLSSLRVLQQCSLINVIGERYQTHPIIRHFCSHQDLMSLQYKGSLQEFYIDLASSESYKVQAQKHAEMVLEVNNTKAMLFYLLKSNYDNQSKLVNSILTFTLFHASIGDLSDKLISQTIEYLKKSQASKPLLIRCHQTWGKLYYFASSFKQAKDKVQEAEKLCSSISDKNGPLHATLLRDLGELHLLDGALNEAEASYQKALELHIIAKDVVGQGSDYKGLGDTYLRLRKLDEQKLLMKRLWNSQAYQ